MDGKRKSVFDSHEFASGFIDFASSTAYEKYMVPFLEELIESHRDKLESTKDFQDCQSRLKAIRFVKDMPDVLKAQKEQIANGE